MDASRMRQEHRVRKNAECLWIQCSPLVHAYLVIVPIDVPWIVPLMCWATRKPAITVAAVEVNAVAAVLAIPRAWPTDHVLWSRWRTPCKLSPDSWQPHRRDCCDLCGRCCCCLFCFPPKDDLDLLFLTHGHPPNVHCAQTMPPPIADISTHIRRAGGGGAAYLFFSQPLEQQNHALTLAS